MLAEDVGSLIPGLPPLDVSGPGGGYHPVGSDTVVSPSGGTPYGPKMPYGKAIETNQTVKKVQAIKQKEADTMPFFHYLGLNGTWGDVGVYSILFVLFVLGVIGLLLAAGNSSPVKEATKIVKKGL